MGEQDDTPGLARLKFLLEEGFERSGWKFDGFLSAIDERLLADDQAFYSALAAAILDPEKVREMERFERWEKIEPTPIDQSWQMED